MKKEDEIKIYRVENGFSVRISSESSMHPTLVFVYNHTRDLLADMDRFLAREEPEETAEERLEREAAERRADEIMEE